MNRDELPCLDKFCSAYFHQDWYRYATDAEAVIRQYLEEEPRSAVVQAIDEIDRLLSMNLSEEQLRNILVYDLSCYYDPSFYGISYLEWLHWVQISLKLRTYQRVEVSA